MDREPFQEELPHLPRQPEHDVARAARARLVRGFEDRLHLVVAEAGHDGGDHHAHRHAGTAERPERLQPLRRRRCARLHGAGEAALQGGDRQRDRGEPAPRHAGEDIDIARHQRRLGDDADRVVVAVEHLEHAPRQCEAALGRLVGVRVGAHGDHAAAIAGAGQLARELRRRVVLGEDAALEILAGREAEIGMGRARVAIDAAVLAAAIDVDRTVEAEVGRVVARDHRAARVGPHLGAQRRRRLVDGAPAVVESLAAQALVAPAPVARRPPPLAQVPHRRTIDRRKEHYKNIRERSGSGPQARSTRYERPAAPGYGRQAGPGRAAARPARPRRRAARRVAK